MAGAVAASTSTVRVGSWVFSAATRNPGLTVKMAETLDEISDGRFIFGLGSGHPADFGQGAAFGFPEEKTVSRYEEALEEIIVPALRGEIVSWEGRYHRAHELEIRPRGPRPGRIPLMLGAHGPRTMRLAAKHADIWSSAAMDDSRPEWFAPMIDRVEEACAAVGRESRHARALARRHHRGRRRADGRGVEDHRTRLEDRRAPRRVRGDRRDAGRADGRAEQ